MDFFKEYLEIILLGIAGLASWFSLKGKVEAQSTRLDIREAADVVAATDLAKVAAEAREAALLNSQAIRELQMQQVSTIENREMVNRMLEKQDVKMEKMDHKMDEMLKGITAVATKLQERTKELHS